MLTKHSGVSALLDLAADLMEEHGWRTGTYWDAGDGEVITNNEYTGGAMCTEGAIRAASTLIWSEEMRRDDRRLFTRRQETEDAFKSVAELVPDDQRHPTLSGSVFAIPWWNDTHCCSKEEAVSLLRDAATKTRPDS